MTTVLSPSTDRPSAIVHSAATTIHPDAQKGNVSQFVVGVGTKLPPVSTAPTRAKASSALGDSTEIACGPLLADPMLAMCADVVADLEAVRIANQNRLRALTDDSELGHGLSVHNPDVMRLQDLFEDLERAEKKAIKNLQVAMRAHPLGEWQRSRKYVGEKQLGRLLGVIRDPYWNDLHDRPRKIRELYAYCGMHVADSDTAQNMPGSHASGGGVAPTKTRGQRANWNDSARMRIWNIAGAQVKGPGAHYRPLYDESRIKYADSVHMGECRRCGPKGKPAQPGSPLSDGHKHARAIRIVSKAILRDLWEESRRLHKEMAS